MAVRAFTRCPFAALTGGRTLAATKRGGGGGGGGGGGRCFDKDAVDQKAAERAGLTLDEAWSVDEVNLYDRLGLDTLQKFSTAFYTSFYKDKPYYEALFKTHPLEQSIENQWSFLAQRFGGPQLFNELKGGPAQMLRRHEDYPCNDTTAERWLHHSQIAFEQVPEIDDDSRLRMERFFKWMAYFLVEGQKARKEAGCGQGRRQGG
ncbi:hypothetical protein COHA_003352 [Chlorella ohadii]|uniref:Uncharacterized protein n=1 Tax=Chlorella ohadii TaxID=2649997 RepID=A0AAD5H7E1_9CHLO|nr:hypothetical protein COHA_003352 [Chlorella ohadii]